MGKGNIRKWTEEEDEQLRWLAGKYSATKIGEKIGRRKHSVLVRMRILGVQGFKQGKQANWTYEQFEDLKANSRFTTTKKWAVANGISFQSVRHWARKWNLKFKIYAVKWTDEELEVLRTSKTPEEVMFKTGRERGPVIRKACQMGVKLSFPRVEKPKKEKKPKAVCKPQPINVARKLKKVFVQQKSMIQNCPSCCAPVSNWQDHWSRMPRCRVLKQA